MISKPIYIAYEWFLEKKVRKGKIPKHIAIIMDGNRRLARKKGLFPWAGHKLGAKKLEEVLEWCFELGIPTVTAYAFSTENFNRPKEEKENIFDLFEEYFTKVAHDKRIHQRKVKIKAIGDIEKFPTRVKKAIKKAEDATKNYENFHLNLAVGYGGRQEILDAVKRVAIEVKEGKLRIDSIDEELFNKKLYTQGLPDPDLIIRTSGEERISGFLLWQSAYSELYFCESYWPGFRKIDFLRAIRTFQQRERRFGR